MTIKKQLEASGYVPDASTAQAVRSVLGRTHGLRVLLLSGPPGSGKTSLAAAIAAATGAAFLPWQLHEWTDADELFVGVDVAAAVAGEAAAVRQPGVLARAAELAEQGPVVLLLDELDKAPERVEYLLLDALESGRVPVAPGQHLRLRADNLVVVITTNEIRPHSEALIRRCRRLRLRAMDPDRMIRIAAERTGAPIGVVRLTHRVATEIGSATVAVAELIAAVEEILGCAEDIDGAAEAIAGWIARDSATAAKIRSAKALPGLWAEVVASRRRAT